MQLLNDRINNSDSYIRADSLFDEILKVINYPEMYFRIPEIKRRIF
jgi:hypothetical protein